MDFNILALLFIAFSVISSLVSKWQQRRREDQGEERTGRAMPTAKPAVPDLSEWDVFQEPEPEEPVREFREVRGTRPVSEEYTGPEFQEVRGARTISEQTYGPEFRDPLSVDQTEVSPVDVSKRVDPKVRVAVPGKKTRKRRRILLFDRNALVNAVLYREILGTPRGEDMPW